MVTPHLPPHQAANALLPHLLGRGLGARGHAVRYLTLGEGPDTDLVRFVRRRGSTLRATRLPQLAEAAETWWKLRPLLRDCDLVWLLLEDYPVEREYGAGQAELLARIRSACDLD